MLSHKVLMPGQKLRKIRKSIGASQEDITGGCITRSLISQIENGKVKLVTDTAAILVENINKIIHENNINMTPITIDYLMEEVNEQIDQILELYKTELKHIQMGQFTSEAIRSKLKEIELFFKQNNVAADKMCEIYEVVANIFFSASSWQESKIYFLKCIELSLIKEQYANMLRFISKLTYIYYRLDNPGEVITFSKYAQQTLYKYVQDDKTDMMKIFYNEALSYNKLNNYEECIRSINRLLSMPGFKSKQILDIKMLLGSCYMKQKKYLIAEDIFNEILRVATETTNANATALAYLNLSMAKLETKDYYHAKLYAQHASSIKATDIYNTAANLYNLVYIYIELNEANLVELNYIDAIECLIRANDEKSLVEIINKLAEYFMKNNYYNNLEKLLSIINHKVSINELKQRELSEIFMLAAEKYIDRDKKKFMEIYKTGISIMKSLRIER